jgi:hypothetical protein
VEGPAEFPDEFGEALAVCFDAFSFWEQAVKASRRREQIIRAQLFGRISILESREY